VPALAVFHCRWCEPETEHIRRMLPSGVAGRSVLARLNCSARMEAEFAIKAFGEGFDGVLVIGCEMGGPEAWAPQEDLRAGRDLSRAARGHLGEPLRRRHHQARDRVIHR
jgi:hypothetical protein